ncbi:MAG: tyrosine-type recombinase/integrase [Chakrabartia sp.]
MTKITKRAVEAAAPKDKEYYIWDEDIPGLGLRVLPSGRRQYIVQYRAGRRSRRISLGPSTVLTTEQARSRALAILADARGGKDPAADREAYRNALLLKDLVERFDQQHISLRLKPRTAAAYRRSLAKFIVPKLGKLLVTEITRADVTKFHHDLRHIPYEANRCLEIISKMFNLAELWGLRPDGSNPRRLIQKYPEVKRERYLSMDEIKHLGDVLREVEQEGREMPSAILAIRLLIYTGCRLSEIMTLQWDYVDLEARTLNLPDSKSGAKKVFLGRPACELLGNAPRQAGNPWVITGTLPGARLTDLQPFWQRVRARAGIPEVRIHDLRHTFASTAIAAGHSLPIIGKLLGHTQVQTTARYAHLAAQPAMVAADSITDVLDRTLAA